MNFAQIATQNNPDMNTISEKMMKERISKIFTMMGDALKKSFGPMGSHTLISMYPYYHTTKDGFTIMKYLRFNHETGPIDMALATMISDICSRLNFAVGDGTTSAVLATNSVYRSFLANEEKIKTCFPQSRMLLKELEKISMKIVENLRSKAVDIRSLDVDKMTDYIRQVVYVSSNANEEMTDIITTLYKDLEFPAISVIKADDGVTKGYSVNGFMFHAHLCDRLYVNNDNDTQDGRNYDLILFDHKVSLEAYHMIIKPIKFLSAVRGRKLICLAPMYDDVALNGDIKTDANNEYSRIHDNTLVLMAYKATTGFEKKMAADLAMLCNTEPITKSKEFELLTAAEGVKKEFGNSFLDHYPVNIDERDIPGILVKKTFEELSAEENPSNGFKYWEDNGKNRTEEEKEELGKKYKLRVGFVGKASLAMTKNSIFSDFHYDQELYKKYLTEAEKDLAQAIEKYKRLGNFNTEIDEAQKRLLGLKMKIGTVEVGASSEFSQDFMKDAMDDAVKAAQSAWNNGIVIGGHVTLLSAIRETMNQYGVKKWNPDAEEAIESTKKEEGISVLLNAIYDGFCDVRDAVFSNGFDNTDLTIDDNIDMTDDICLDFLTLGTGYRVELFGGGYTQNDEVKTLTECVETIQKKKRRDGNVTVNLYDLIREYEISNEVCLDLDVKYNKDYEPTIYFGKNVVNSAATDREILVAVSDMIGLVSTGNQMVMALANQG